MQIEKAATAAQLSPQPTNVFQSPDSRGRNDRIVGGMIGKSTGTVSNKELDPSAMGEQSCSPCRAGNHLRRESVPRTYQFRIGIFPGIFPEIDLQIESAYTLTPYGYNEE
jgi:hypothetical protein